MNVVSLAQLGIVKDIKPGDQIVIDGLKVRVTAIEKTNNPLKLVVGGPMNKTAVGIQLTFEDGKTAIVHPSDSVRIIRS